MVHCSFNNIGSFDQIAIHWDAVAKEVSLPAYAPDAAIALALKLASAYLSKFEFEVRGVDNADKAAIVRNRVAAIGTFAANSTLEVPAGDERDTAARLNYHSRLTQGFPTLEFPNRLPASSRIVFRAPSPA